MKQFKTIPCAILVLGGIATAAPIEMQTKSGGLAGFGTIKEHVHGANCVSTGDKANMRRDLQAYIRDFGPLSRPGLWGDNRQYSFFPVGAREWVDLYMENYVDLDPSEGGFQDWNCGGYSYDGHKGIDALIGTFEQQFVGVPIYSALDGVVWAMRDGEPDQNTVWDPDALSNYVGIDHGEGRYANYFHMKQGSVLVEIGQEVKAGEQIGLVASSGYSSWPHLHFETWIPDGEDDWKIYEPYAGDCNVQSSGWENQVSIPEGARCRDFGVTTANLDDFFVNEEYMWTPPLEGYIPLDHDGVWMWMQATDIGIFSTYQMRFYDPGGVLQHDTGTNWLNFSWNSYRFYITWFYWDIPELHTIPGTWTVDVIVNDASFLSFPLTMVTEFEHTPNRAPEPISATISPYFPTVDDVLSCIVITDSPLADLDWDLVRYQYTWSVGGNVLREATSAGLADHLPKLDACPGAVVQCTVVPSDGVTNGAPYTTVVRIAGVSNGDINCDGGINITDLLLLIADWGSCELCAGDLNHDGETNIHDLLILIGNWG